ncbi:MAG: hypothetical protein KatS3mg131_0743 [Candidatus Tectimicrobiota bacterium]|nr:MAG: hypothetical protein KatS3mg131_0743 [Candidatus Tectomicrobia bacterium]
MEKVNLIAWRRREKKFPETEAQRRARLRALEGPASPGVSSSIPCSDAFAPAGESLAEVALALSPEQSRLLEALPLWTAPGGDEAPRWLFEMTTSQDRQGIVLHFSLHTEAVPEMLSLQELCRQLKVGRRAVMRLVRQGRLRCYRIGRQYRFVAAEVRHSLAHLAWQQQA